MSAPSLVCRKLVIPRPIEYSADSRPKASCFVMRSNVRYYHCPGSGREPKKMISPGFALTPCQRNLPCQFFGIQLSATTTPDFIICSARKPFGAGRSPLCGHVLRAPRSNSNRSGMGPPTRKTAVPSGPVWALVSLRSSDFWSGAPTSPLASRRMTGCPATGFPDQGLSSFNRISTG